MQYDGNNPLHVEQARTRLEQLIKNKKVFELTEKKPKRSLSQNSFLWLILGYWGVQTGYTKDEAEAIYKIVNRDLYYRKKEVAGQVIDVIRHTYELDVSEMAQSIDKWRNWAAQNEACPVYIPSADDYNAVMIMEREVNICASFL
ncbi:hypothetical protein [Bacteroides pyogenes]|uniref:hypothetical protein n=1 Tax=Bacteroides pyogenes TaxID=310300 RepID=UPI001BAC4206|nr:hypothetical protein [Bacteroides pyogenes]MBR8704895.1 hypothetical protein [Bacteroides pyogenes]